MKFFTKLQNRILYLSLTSLIFEPKFRLSLGLFAT